MAFFPPGDSTFSWVQKHSQHPWIPGCGHQSNVHNMVTTLFCWTPAKYDCICFVVIPQLIEWFCVTPAAGTTTPVILSYHKFSLFSCCFFANLPLIDHYFVSLSCWERRKRASVWVRMFAIEVSSFLILSHDSTLQIGMFKHLKGTKIWVEKKSYAYFSCC